MLSKRAWLFAAAFALAACGGPLKYEIHGTPKAPESDTKVVADVQEKQSLTKLEITIEHLAPPDRLSSGGTTFVVWAKKGDAAWQRVGALDYDKDARKGTIKEASVPLTSFELSVTIESKPDPAAPSSDVVLAQKVN